MGRPNLSREANFSGANGDRGISVFLAQLTTSKIGNLTRLTHTLLYVIIHTYIHYIHIPPKRCRGETKNRRDSGCRRNR